VSDATTPAVRPGTRPGRARLLVIEHEGDTGLGRLHPPLAERLDVEVRRMHRGEPVPADAGAEGYSGLVVLGGVPSAWDDDVAPWLPATRRLMATAVEQGLPTFGICLGGQLLAAACGGEVRRGEAGLEVGVVDLVTLSAADDDPLLAGVPRTGTGAGAGFRAAQWHQDAVVALPPGAVPLVTGERYPHQAYRLGDRAWGVQYHPEVSRADWATWIAGGSGSLVENGVNPGSMVESMARDDDALEAVAVAHARAFAALVVEHAGADTVTA
jgi:GMP synthase (glutamine-hydrolysing)